MKVGIPKEIKNNENRVGMTPADSNPRPSALGRRTLARQEPETNAKISQNAFIYRPFKDSPFSLCGYFAAITDGNLVHLLISL